jgi:hypothetical protein
MSDAAGDDLLAQIAGGDMRALELLYREMGVQVFAVALAVTGEPPRKWCRTRPCAFTRQQGGTGPGPGPGRGC